MELRVQEKPKNMILESRWLLEGTIFAEEVSYVMTIEDFGTALGKGKGIRYA